MVLTYSDTAQLIQEKKWAGWARLDRLDRISNLENSAQFSI